LYKIPFKTIEFVPAMLEKKEIQVCAPVLVSSHVLRATQIKDMTSFQKKLFLLMPFHHLVDSVKAKANLQEEKDKKQ